MNQIGSAISCNSFCLRISDVKSSYMFFLLAAFFGAQSPLKRLGGGGGGVGQVDLPMVFLKKNFSEKV